MFTKKDVGDADQWESSISRLAGRLAIMDFHETDSGERSAVGVWYVYRTCAIRQLRATVQAPVSGSEAHVAGWGRPAGPVVSVVR